ncbi:uncharacterized protein [Glycine max]|uniref:uncharacterized protein n=1 Tax=Glycine max TaxID=3847 RepID=UPI001B3569C9|nr:uncharacterized protein LOC121174562 [Glycine max]
MAVSDGITKKIVLSYTYVAIWIFLSFTVIEYNKYRKMYSWPYPISLTMIHMVFCSSLAYILICILKLMEAVSMSQDLDLKSIIPIDAFYSLSLWFSNSALESTLNYGLERVWAIGYLKSSHRVVIGYDGGKIMVKLGQEVPVASMDNNGKIFWSKHNEIQTVADEEMLPLVIKESGTCDLYPQEYSASVSRSPFPVGIILFGRIRRSKGVLDLDLALQVGKTATITDASSNEEKTHYKT